MNMLGVHLGHNSSVSLLRDGQIIFALQEERLRGIKNYGGFPSHALREVLSSFNLKPSDFHRVALASHRAAPGSSVPVLLDTYRNQMTAWTTIRNSLLQGIAAGPIGKAIRSIRRGTRGKHVNTAVELLLRSGFREDQLDLVEHHLCHAAAAYYGLRRSPEEEYLVLTLDGGGDGLCATVSVARSGVIQRIAATDSGHSLGSIWSRVTFLLGFVPWEHEYKLMGMAPYVSSERAGQVATLFHRYLGLDQRDPLMFRRKVPESLDVITRRLHNDFTILRFDHICAGLQRFTEDLLVQWVRACIHQTGIRRILCGGGVFMNVKANQRIAALPEVDYIDVFPSCGDETNSIGAVYSVFSTLRDSDSVRPLAGAFYLGSAPVDEDLRSAVHGSGFPYEVVAPDQMSQRVAECLAAGQIVARCTGRMEFGARALGNRSILADPKSPDLVRVINRMVKNRDFWMPFAPVMRREVADRYLVNPKEIVSPYMMFTFDSTNHRVDMIAALHNADLTARAQIIERSWNPEYYDILVEFEKLTGRGALLNTSFNLHGFPIVNGPKEALGVFGASGLDVLALGNFLVTKTNETTTLPR